MKIFDWVKNIGKSVKTELDGLIEEGKSIEQEKDAPPFFAKKQMPKWEPIAPIKEEVVKELVEESIGESPKINQEIKEKYNKIVRKIKERQEEINKSDGTNIESLKNELNVYKKKADELKKKLYL